MNTTQMRPFLNIPPGDFIADEIESRGWTQETLAEVLGVSLTTVSKLIKARQAITVEMAKKLSEAFGQSPQYWLSLESNYQLRRADTSEGSSVRQDSELFSKVPVSSLRKKGWVSEDASPDDVRSWLGHLWQTTDVEMALDKTITLPMAARRSSAYSQYNEHHAAVWFQVARRVAQTYDVPPYDRGALEALVAKMPALSTRSDGVKEFLQKLSACGVKTFRLSHLPKTYTDGAAFWDGSNPVVVFTARLDWNDSFWFTMAHEIGHLLLHLTGPDDFVVDEGVDGKDESEQQADGYSEKVFRHGDIVSFFGPSKPGICRQVVEDYARRQGVSPAIVVGCLHHNDMLSHRNLNDLRAKVTPLVPEESFGDLRVRDAVAAA